MNTPSLEILVVLGLGVLALLFFGYQLDELHRRVKEFECDCSSEKITDLLELQNKHIRMLDSFIVENDNLTKNYEIRIRYLEEQIKPKPPRKRGRPKKIVNGKNDTPWCI